MDFFMVDRHMGDGESACVSVCFKSSGFCYNKGGAEANADDEAIHVGPHCISNDEKGKCTSENFVTAVSVKWMASNILITNNVMLSLAKILTHMDKPISAQCCLVVGGIRTSKRKSTTTFCLMAQRRTTLKPRRTKNEAQTARLARVLTLLFGP